MWVLRNCSSSTQHIDIGIKGEQELRQQNSSLFFILKRKEQSMKLASSIILV